MRRSFTLTYWRDDDWYVGRLEEVPGVFSQGETLEELEENIRDAYELVRSETPPLLVPQRT
ncbi:MAG: type II toxin-antitoxin system HicB family antitoxin [Acidobacteriota bacterium]|nr:type II toxin-antitoxin system HicB family antitoxin [Gemmatimonadota bacterium]MDH3522542.1 type II toxin-antitoxin system HicB family antitoxin [Acidobacteriota bacterium]